VLTGGYEKPLFCDSYVSAIIGPHEEMKNDCKESVVYTKLIKITEQNVGEM
jgi:hypothetical protein